MASVGEFIFGTILLACGILIVLKREKYISFEVKLYRLFGVRPTPGWVAYHRLGAWLLGTMLALVGAGLIGDGLGMVETAR